MFLSFVIVGTMRLSIKQILLDVEKKKRNVKELRQELASRKKSRIVVSNLYRLRHMLIQVPHCNRFDHPFIPRKKLSCDLLYKWFLTPFRDGVWNRRQVSVGDRGVLPTRPRNCRG